MKTIIFLFCICFLSIGCINSKPKLIIKKIENTEYILIQKGSQTKPIANIPIYALKNETNKFFTPSLDGSFMIPLEK